MRTVFLTGFGAFEDVQENPSGALVRQLSERSPAGLCVVGGVLPVSFRRVPDAFDRLLEGESPELLVALGVHRGSYLRLESGAGGPERNGVRVDVDGETAAAAWAPGPRLATELDLVGAAERLRARGSVEVRVSEDAGGYVCDRTYAHLLARAAERDLPGLFVHVPPVEALALTEQRALLEDLLQHLLGEPG